jgi:integrase
VAIRTNPFIGIRVDVPKVAVLREGGKAFKPDEAQVILRAASTISNMMDAFPRAKRWVMWLCAYSGARAGEITQLRGIDVTQRGDFYVMRLTPEAGSIKTSIARTVPLHEHLVEQGFIEFVRAQGDGPLFYNRRVAKAAQADPLKPKMTSVSPSTIDGMRRVLKKLRDAGEPEPVIAGMTYAQALGKQWATDEARPERMLRHGCQRRPTSSLERLKMLASGSC